MVCQEAYQPNQHTLNRNPLIYFLYYPSYCTDTFYFFIFWIPLVDSNNQNFHHHTFGLLRSRSLTPVSDFRPLPGAHPVPVPEPSLLLQFFRANITVTCSMYGCHVSPHRFECLQPPTNLLPFDPFGPYHSTYHLTCHSTWHLISSAPTI